MQKKFKEDLLKILKSHENLQKSVLKANENNLNNFRSDSEPFKSLFESFKDTSKREIKSKALSGDLDKDQLKAK